MLSVPSIYDRINLYYTLLPMVNRIFPCWIVVCRGLISVSTKLDSIPNFMIWKPSLSFTSIISLEWFQLFKTLGFYVCIISWQLHSSFLRSMKSILELRHPILFQLLPSSANEMWKNNRRISVIMLKKNLIRFLFWMPLNANPLQHIIDSNFGEFISTYISASCTVSQKHQSTRWLLACALHTLPILLEAL